MNYFWILFVIFILVNTIISVVTVFSDRNRDIATIWAWLLVLIVFPGFGLIIYVFLGRKISKEDIFNLREQAKVGLPEYLEMQEELKEEQIAAMEPLDFRDSRNNQYEISKVLMNVDQPPIAFDNSVEFYVEGEAKFRQLIQDIKNAKHHVHVLYYIFRGDKLGKAIVEALEERAKNGVEVKVLYDPVGARDVKSSLFKSLEEYGGQAEASFGSRFHLLNIRLNYRNHRKIVVIDGEIGYTGGFNVGDDYLGEYEHMGYWRDTHLRLEGSAVHQLQARFINDWNASQKTDLIAYAAEYFPFIPTKGDKEVQIVSSGPDTEDEAIKKGFIKMISMAKKSIYIQTPYFIPDGALKESIEIAVLSGVNVKLMIPNKPDHPFVYQATLSYAEELMNMGGEVYIYDKGFLHAKTILIDEKMFSVGTANFDIRSFRLNFEVNTFVYDEELALEHIDYFKQDMKDSYRLTKEIIDSYSLWDRFKQQFSRLLSPIL